jgi:hypothetical protein
MKELRNHPPGLKGGTTAKTKVERDLASACFENKQYAERRGACQKER